MFDHKSKYIDKHIFLQYFPAITVLTASQDPDGVDTVILKLVSQQDIQKRFLCLCLKHDF